MLRTAYAFEDSTPGAPSRDDSTPPRKEDYCGHRLDENPRRERTVWSRYRFYKEKAKCSYRVRVRDVKWFEEK